MAEIKNVIEIKFEEAKKKVIAKNDEFMRNIEEEINKISTKFSSMFSK
ncbi:MAG: hypothetical protein QW193_01590 [Nitrososphaerales archaeon]